MSGSAGGVLDTFTNPVLDVADRLPDPLNIRRATQKDNLLGKSLRLTAPGFLDARRARKKLEAERAQAEAASERERSAFNENIFRLATDLQGNVAQNPQFDFDSLRFIGDDARQGQLQNLVNIFQRRSNEVLSQRFEPGASQTRLSLVE